LEVFGIWTVRCNLFLGRLKIQDLSKIRMLLSTVKIRFPQIENYRLKLWSLLAILLIIVSTLTRIALLIKSWQFIDPDVGRIAGIFFFGFLFDCVNVVYFSLPFVLYLWLMPERVFKKRWHKIVIIVLFFLQSAILIFNSVAEWLFWDEFNARFNFIAVDYLVYTTEVIGNITQSYSLPGIIAGICLASIIVVSLLYQLIKRRESSVLSFRQRTRLLAIYSVLFSLSFFTVSSSFHHFSKNAFANELAGNGMYELFAAYLHNELSYDRFYKGVDQKDAITMINKLVITPEASLIDNSIPTTRKITNIGTEKKLNVVLISVESFSADFMKLFGNTENITPFLDSLSTRSMMFTNLFATGTRTVRGLEALSLCVPPTPGQSIVRRPENEQLFSLASVFKEKGYHCQYIYGGYGYFDNMNYFFSNNDYEVVDRTELDDSDIHYENIWGVADEDLFTLAMRQIDKHTIDQPVFVHVMTTSNHRPFTYPDGRIDIPSHTGRSGAVKYTDFAIGDFLKKAQNKPWFDSTVFIIVADHCASSAGKTELPVNKYHIPMLIYSPKNIQPATVDRLMSQIDIGPTLLGMLNFSYTSKFYGYDIFKLEAGRERAFISTYQNLGYMKDNKLVILSPMFKVEAYTLSPQLERGEKISDDNLVNEAIAWYESASYAFREGLMKK
jgi:phosphoglycerol transferase MdoB-like AlkP superfamily enzyme